MSEQPVGGAHPTPNSGLLPWLVGVFAVWQIASVPLANALEFVPLRKTVYDIDPPVITPQRWGTFTKFEPLQATVETVAFALSTWGEFTGQEQGWNMFTPGFPPQTVVPCAELLFADGSTARAYSRFEPTDRVNPPSRWPLIRDREFNYEANLFMISWDGTPEAIAARPDVWRQLPDRVRDDHSLLMAWLRWRVRDFQKHYPDKHPMRVTLILRCFPTPPPDDPRAAPGPMHERPFARLILDRDPHPGELPLEGYDPVANEWVRLWAWDGP